MSDEDEAAWVAIAAKQSGLITTAQALAAGLSKEELRWCLEDGTWQVVHHGVHCVHTGKLTFEQRCRAACMALGDDFAISGTAAATLLCVDGFHTTQVEISGPRRVRQRKGVVIHQAPAYELGETMLVNGCRVTSATRLLPDLAAILPEGRLEEVLDMCLLKGRTSIQRLTKAVERMSGRPGIDVLRQQLIERDPETKPTQSVFETRMRRKLLAAGLEAAQQHLLFHDGAFVARLDFAFRHVKVCIEPGGLHHWTEENRRKDAIRRADIQLAGWRVLEVTWQQLKYEPNAVIEMIQKHLGAAEQRDLPLPVIEAAPSP